MTTCVRCGADLTKPPHVKLCWQGVPGASAAGKGDLCDPCHREWEAEKQAPPAPEPESWQDHHRWVLDAEEREVCEDCGTSYPGDGPCDERPWTAEEPRAAPVQCGKPCDKPGCDERCVLPLGHLGYHSCPGPNEAQRARGQT